MPPPNALTIATSSLQRLVKEEASYHRELELQRESIRKLEAAVRRRDEGEETDDGKDGEVERGNQEFALAQEVSEIVIYYYYYYFYVYFYFYPYSRAASLAPFPVFSALFVSSSSGSVLEVVLERREGKRKSALG